MAQMISVALFGGWGSGQGFKGCLLEGLMQMLYILGLPWVGALNIAWLLSRFPRKVNA